MSGRLVHAAMVESPLVDGAKGATGGDHGPPMLNYVLSFILVGLAWGFTTPFIRRAARNHRSTDHPMLRSPTVRESRWRSLILGAAFAALDLLRNPAYALPLLINITGSLWFLLLIGQAGTYGISNIAKSIFF